MMNVKTLLSSLFYKAGSLGFVNSLMKRYQGKVVILAYHRVVPYEVYARDFSPIRLSTVSVNQFENQVRYISNTYQVISIDNVPDFLLDSSQKTAVVITIDDGYKDTIQYALPILEKYKTPATVYINTCFPDEKEEIWWVEIADILSLEDRISIRLNGKDNYWYLRDTDEKITCFNEFIQLVRQSSHNKSVIMSQLRKNEVRSSKVDMKYALDWDEIRKLDKNSLITIGAHTHNHLTLPKLPMHEVEYEMLYSKKRLEEELGHCIEHFAYPFGGIQHAGDREVELAAKCGFKTAVTIKSAGVHKEHKDHLYSLPRYAVSESDTITRLKTKISGCEAFIRNKLSYIIN